VVLFKKTVHVVYTAAARMTAAAGNDVVAAPTNCAFGIESDVARVDFRAFAATPL
jgi:L-serine deaminase